MNVPNFPDLDASSDDGSVVNKLDNNNSTTATAAIKPGGEDNDPRPPMRSVSPSPPASAPMSSSSSSSSKMSSHRKMSQKTRLLSNPLDAYDKSPEQAIKPKGAVVNMSGSTTTNTNTTTTTTGSITPGETKIYGYEDAAPTTTTKNSKNNNNNSRARSPPPMSMSSGAAKALRRGVPASEARGLNGGNGNSTKPLRRLPPNRSNLKKASSFNATIQPKKSILASKKNNNNNNKNNNNGNDDEPTRGLTRRASMGSTHTTTIEVRVRGERFPVQRRRSINFDQRVEIKEVEPVTNLVSGNCAEIWLQEEDFAKMKQDRRNLVHRVKKTGLPTKEETLETGGMRGLEKYVDKSIRAAKNLAWDTVLLEQDEQELSGDYNEERIADLYRHFTRESPDKAVARAKQDEQEIQDYLWSPRTTKLMLRRLPPTMAAAPMVVDATSTTINNNTTTTTTEAESS